MENRSSIALFVLGVTFLAMGVVGPRAFLAVGVVFLLIGGGLVARQRRGGRSK